MRQFARSVIFLEIGPRERPYFFLEPLYRRRTLVLRDGGKKARIDTGCTLHRGAMEEGIVLRWRYGHPNQHLEELESTRSDEQIGLGISRRAVDRFASSHDEGHYRGEEESAGYAPGRPFLGPRNGKAFY